MKIKNKKKIKKSKKKINYTKTHKYFDLKMKIQKNFKNSIIQNFSNKDFLMLMFISKKDFF